MGKRLVVLVALTLTVAASFAACDDADARGPCPPATRYELHPDLCR